MAEEKELHVEIAEKYAAEICVYLREDCERVQQTLLNFIMFATARLKTRAGQAADNCEALRAALGQYNIDFMGAIYGEWRTHQEFDRIKALAQGGLAQTPAMNILKKILLGDKMNLHNLETHLNKLIGEFKNEDVENDIVWPYFARNLDGYERQRKIWQLMVTKGALQKNIPDFATRISFTKEEIINWLTDSHHRICQSDGYKIPGPFYTELGYELATRRKGAGDSLEAVLVNRLRFFEHNARVLMFRNKRLYDTGEEGRELQDVSGPDEFGDASQSQRVDYSIPFMKDEPAHVKPELGRNTYGGLGLSGDIKREQIHGASSSHQTPYYRPDAPAEPVRREGTLNYLRPQGRGWDHASRRNEYTYDDERRSRSLSSQSTIRLEPQSLFRSGEIVVRGSPVEAPSRYDEDRSRSMSTMRVSEARFDHSALAIRLPSRNNGFISYSRTQEFDTSPRSQSARTGPLFANDNAPRGREIGRSIRPDDGNRAERNRNIRERSPALPRDSDERGRSRGMKILQMKREEFASRSPRPKVRRRSPSRERRSDSRSRARSSSDSRGRERARPSTRRSKPKHKRSHDRRRSVSASPPKKKAKKTNGKGIPDIPASDKNTRKSSSSSSSRSRSRSRSRSSNPKEKKIREKKGEKKSSQKKRKVAKDKKARKDKSRRSRPRETSPETCSLDSDYEWITETVNVCTADLLLIARTKEEVARYYKNLHKKAKRGKTHTDSFDGVGGNEYRACCVNKEICRTEDGDLNVQWTIFSRSSYMLCTACWVEFSLMYKDFKPHKKLENEWLVPISEEPLDRDRQRKDVEKRILKNVDLEWFVNNIKQVEEDSKKKKKKKKTKK